MHRKRIAPLLFSVLLSLTILTPAYAAEAFTGNSGTTEVNVYNEYDYIMALKNAPSQQALTQNNTNAVEEIRAFEEAFAARAAMPDDTLEQLGYSPDEIRLLRRYASGETLTDSEMRAVSATCTGEITKQGFSGKLVMFTYTWTWNKSPTIRKQDSYALVWCAFDSNIHAMDGIEPTAKEAKIKYYVGQTYQETLSGTFQESLVVNATNVQFNVTRPAYYDSTGALVNSYAKTGYVKVTVGIPKPTGNEIYYMHVSAAYAHTTIGYTFPSLSIGYPPSIAISFTGNLSIENIAGHKVRIDRSPGCTTIP